ncbi:MAG: transglutaminase-like domain-containing protein [Planctomycetia bacterium]|nr:transglutaminase-like domain-containing protein [Planctomycetia bacterium]
MKTIRVFAMLVFLAAGAARSSAAEPTHAIVKTPSKHIKATLTFRIDAPEIEATNWIIFTPLPPVLPSQHAIKASFEPDGKEYRELSPRSRKILRAQVPVSGTKNAKKFEGHAVFEASLVARHLVVREEEKTYGPADELTSASREFNLRATPIFDFESEAFTDWLDEEKLWRRKSESELHFARRVFIHLKNTLTYEYKADMDRVASHVCEAGKSDCGGLSILFVSVMRANEIPARVLAGCWAKSAKADAMLGGIRYYQAHIKGEFYLEGVGWVPLDLSSAVSYEKEPEGLTYFGHDRGDFITMHVDPELKLDTGSTGIKSINWLQQYHYYVQGKGNVKNTKQTIGWVVE